MEFYDGIAEWWPVISPPEEYAEEAALYVGMIRSAAVRPVREVLELGSGGGNNASHMKRQFAMTLVEPSEGLREVSRALNPECEHLPGDMRSVRLGRRFDAVFVQDAVDYMTTEEDLRAALATVAAHLAPGGAALVAPDATAETFEEATEHGGGGDGSGRSARYLEWTLRPEPGETSYAVHYVFLLCEPGGDVRTVHDVHRCGVFGRVAAALPGGGAPRDARAADHRGRTVRLVRRGARRVVGPRGDERTMAGRRRVRFARLAKRAGRERLRATASRAG